MRRFLALGALGLSLGLSACSSDSLVGPEVAPVRAEEGITDPSRVWKPYSVTPVDDGRVWKPYDNVSGCETAATEDVSGSTGTPSDDGRVWRPYETVECNGRVWKPY